MTGTSPKSAISNAENGKAISGAWPNHVSACQNERLGSATRQTAADKANHCRKPLGKPLRVLLPCRKAIQMGNAG